MKANVRHVFSTAVMAVLGVTLLITPVSAKVKDVTTRPDAYFLKASEVADSMALLPPPPAEDSDTFERDKGAYSQGLKLRDTERGRQAFHDADMHADGVAAAFSEAFGMEISKRNTPFIFRLLSKMREDAGDLATRSAKEHYKRQRPFAYYKTDTCNTREQKKLSTNGSYPSGHTAIGWATALVLAEINPARQNEILKRGFEIGQSRVICGYHWQSDVDAGRLVAAAVVARLHSSDLFMWHLNRAKEEFAIKSGK